MHSAHPRKRIRRSNRKRRSRQWAYFTPGSALENRLQKLLSPTAGAVVKRLICARTNQIPSSIKTTHAGPITSNTTTTDQRQKPTLKHPASLPTVNGEEELYTDMAPLQLSQMSDAVDILLRASQTLELNSDPPSDSTPSRS